MMGIILNFRYRKAHAEKLTLYLSATDLTKSPDKTLPAKSDLNCVVGMSKFAANSSAYRSTNQSSFLPKGS